MNKNHHRIAKKLLLLTATSRARMIPSSGLLWREGARGCLPRGPMIKKDVRMTRWALILIWTLIALPGWAQENTADTLDALLEQGAQAVLDGAQSHTPETALPDSAPPMLLDVHQAVAIALERNAQVLMAEEELTVREAQRGQATALRHPQVSTRAAYTYIDKLDQEVTGSRFASILLQTDGFAPDKGQFTTQFSIEQVLYAGGQIQAGIRASKYLEQSEAWKKQAVLDQLEYETRQAFYDCLLARALTTVAQESIGTFERHLADVRQMLEVGMVSQFEVLRAETELGARQADLVSAQSMERIALVNLRRILTLPQDTPLELAGELEWSPVEDDLETLIAAALEQRPELRALDDGIRAAKENVNVKQGQYRPKAAASAEWQSVTGGGRLLPDGWRFSVGAEWDIYTGGRRKHEVNEAKALLRNLEYQRTDVARLVEMDVRQACLRVEEAIAKTRQEKGTVALGAEGLRLAQLRFQEGVGTQVETLNAELALTQARTALVKALRDYAVAIAALDKALARGQAHRETL